MRELVIAKNDAGQRINKYLSKYLSEAPSSFIYKMLRKKNIVLNGKRAKGDEILSEQDVVTLFLSEDTIDGFRGKDKSKNVESRECKERKENIKSKGKTEKKSCSPGGLAVENLKVLYRDKDILAVHKPVGVLSQKAKKEDYSINETILDYCIKERILTEKEMETFRPSICNRLDRNTSGIILAGISLSGSQMLTETIRMQRLDKYYFTVVKGEFQKEKRYAGYLHRDLPERISKVISDEEYGSFDEGKKKNYVRIETEFQPLAVKNGYSLLKIKLITGKTHQIRAHLKALGYSIVGDSKYGDMETNRYMQKKYGLKYQLLHAGEIHFHERNLVIKDIAPEQFLQICKGENLWQHGIPEV